MSNPLDNLRVALDTMQDSITAIANKPAEKPEFLNNEISGDKIHGGRITKFSSVGIQDDATRQTVYVSDNGITVDTINTNTLQGDVTVTNSLTVEGEITAQRLHVNELSADVRNERSTPLEFLPDDRGIYGKGLIWRGEGYSRQFIYRANQDRLWTSESIDLDNDKAYMIGNAVVLTQTTLGSSITESNLTRVGSLSNLHTNGNLVIDEEIFYNSDSNRLGIGTEAPNGQLAIANLEGEFIVDFDANSTKIGNWTSSDLEVITDDTTRIRVSATGKIEFGSKTNNDARLSVYGKLGVGVTNVAEDTSFAVSGPISVQGSKIEYSTSYPSSGIYRKGDIVFNTNPQPSGYVGWICVREGTPGEWKSFGQISS